MVNDRDSTSKDIKAVSIRSAPNLEDFDGFFARTRSSVLSKRTMRRVASEEQLESLASAASMFEQSQSGSTFFRAESSDSWRNVRDLPAARQKHVEIAGSAGSLNREYPAGTVLPEWPAVNDAVVASGKMHLVTFDLDPTTLPSDVLCHLAMVMFVSAGLPAGLAENRVRRFILAVRASMLDNPYHNFFHVFDVMQTTNAFATSTGTMARLDSWERFALLSAALW
jgi:hypothetical protein